MPMVRMQSPKFLSQTPYLFQTPFHLVSLSCLFFILKMPIVYVLFKFLERLKQPLPKIPFCLLAFEFSIGAFFLPLWHAALGLSFIFFAGFLHAVAVSCLSPGRKCRVRLLHFFSFKIVSFSLKLDSRLISHPCFTGPALRSSRCTPSLPYPFSASFPLPQQPTISPADEANGLSDGRQEGSETGS